MFERFTEKALNVVYKAQEIAHDLKFTEVSPEHILLALISEAKGVSLKLFKMHNMTFESVKKELLPKMQPQNRFASVVSFNRDVKELLKKNLDLASKSGNSTILFEHLFLSLILYNNSNVQKILNLFDFDVNYAKEILNKLVQRKIKRLEHPETDDTEEKITSFEALYEDDVLKNILDRAVSKLSTAGYEILGTEQIMESILEFNEYSLSEIIYKNGINLDNFRQQLDLIKSRKSEFENKKIVFTPNAFHIMNVASQIAKEFGSSNIKPEHIILSILKEKKGFAYEIIKSLNIDENKLSGDIIKPIEKQMPETLMIMKLAKEEARRIGRNVVGTEMFLLGILRESSSIAADILNELGITIKEARIEVEKLVGYGDEYFDTEIAFTNRAKRVLEKAWIEAKQTGKQKIDASDLLLAITENPNSLAMKVLSNLGVDAVEIKSGISKQRRVE